jgi:Fe-S cluster biogenesis protein NfuA
MTPGRPPRRIHVEHTLDPKLLRWVPHHPRLDAAPPGTRRVPEHSAIGSLVSDGSIDHLAVRDGNVLVAAHDPDGWTRLAPMVQAALLDELDELDALDAASPHWLLRADETADRLPSIAEVQQTVDRAAGAVTAGHGGAMTVVAVEGDTVRLRGDGACTGCRQSDETIVGIISPALRAAYPEIAEVILDADARQPAQQPAQQPVERSSLPTAGRVSWRARRRQGQRGSCH